MATMPTALAANATENTMGLSRSMPCSTNGDAEM